MTNRSERLSAVHARRASLALCGLLLASAGAHAEVFINELHYDDATASGDTGEGVEVVATAGEDLAAYRIQLYNGSNPGAATRYDDRALPAGNTVSCGASVRIAAVSWPSNGLQNGAADGIALVDGGGALVQFISYEGGVTGADGAAAGHASRDLPVSEPTPRRPALRCNCRAMPPATRASRGHRRRPRPSAPATTVKPSAAAATRSRR